VGSTATVYKYKKRQVGGTFAIKRINNGKTGWHTQMWAEAEKEISALMCLNHPNIVKLVEVVDRRKNLTKGENTLSLIFNYVPGKNLEQHLQRQRDKKKTVYKELFLNWALQLANAVNYLHNEHSIIHSDI